MFFFYSAYITEVVLSALRNHHTTAINYDDAAFLSEPAFFLFKEQAYGRTLDSRTRYVQPKRLLTDFIVTVWLVVTYFI